MKRPKVIYRAMFWWVVISKTEAALGPCVTREQADYIARHPQLWAKWSQA
jgi:hypothetical protein